MSDEKLRFFASHFVETSPLSFQQCLMCIVRCFVVIIGMLDFMVGDNLCAICFDMSRRTRVLSSSGLQFGVRIVHFSRRSQLSSGYRIFPFVLGEHMSVTGVSFDGVHFLGQGIVLGLTFTLFN